MKEFFAFLLTLSVLLCLSVTAMADSTSATEEELVKLEGEYATIESIRADGTARVYPFYLEKPVSGCDYVKVSLSIDTKSGYCGGNYYLYVKDADGNWHHTAVFKVAKSKLDGKTHTYKLNLDQKETFVAAAIWPADKGMDFSAVFKYKLSVNPDCVSEYSDKLPAPNYKAAKSQSPVSSTHVRARGYKDPWEWGLDYLP